MSAVFSPDGRQILTGSFDKTAVLWDSQSGAELRRFVGHTGAVNSVAFSPDGRLVLTGSVDFTCQLWDRATGDKVRTFATNWAVTSVAFSPDGRYFVSGGYDDSARLWDVTTGKEVRRFHGTSVSFSPDGKYVLTGSYDRIARLWDSGSAVEVKRFEGHKWGIVSVAFSPDGKTVATGSIDGTVRLWDRESGRETHQLVGYHFGIKAISFSPDGLTVATGAPGRPLGDVPLTDGVQEDLAIRLWDVRTGTELRSFLRGGVVFSIAFSADGSRILTGERDGSARLRNADTGVDVMRFKSNTDSVDSVAFTRDQGSILVSTRESMPVVWDVQSAGTSRPVRRKN